MNRDIEINGIGTVRVYGNVLLMPETKIVVPDKRYKTGYRIEEFGSIDKEAFYKISSGKRLVAGVLINKE